MTQKQAIEKMMKFCAYQDRCQFEVQQKLYGTGLTQDEIDHVVIELIAQGFINEERFAKSFVRGKFRIKKWGRVKIRLALKQKQISDFCIKKGFKEIDEAEYLTVLESEIDKKGRSLSEPNEFVKKQKIARYVISRGFEPELVWEILD